jgi:hypothetical protein
MVVSKFVVQRGYEISTCVFEQVDGGIGCLRTIEIQRDDEDNTQPKDTALPHPFLMSFHLDTC